METVRSINGGPSTFWLGCVAPDCQTYYDTTVPMAHQSMILRDPSKKLGVFGGYGSGKTFTTMKSDQKHIMLTPKGETLIGADTLIQLENTIKKDLERDFPMDFVRKYNRQKNLVHFENGHLLYYRPLANEGDVRSYNLTRFHALEASEVKYESYVQAQARTRNTAAVVPELDKNGSPIYDYDEETGMYKMREKYNWLQMIVESNPDPGWIRNNFLMKSGHIYMHDVTDQEYHVNASDADAGISSHIIPTKTNYHLPRSFITDLAKGKPDWWVRRYVFGSFEYREGLVYPNYARQIIDDFEVPKHWPRMISYDYGLNDNSHFIFGALDIEGEKMGHPALFLFAELVMNDASVTQLAEAYKQVYRIYVPSVGGLYKTPVMDAKSYGKRTPTEEKKTLGRLFLEQGVLFRGAQMDVNARVMKFNDMIDKKQVYFFKEGVKELNKEAKNYKFPDRDLEGTTKKHEKPIDKENHGVNSAEFLVMEVPSDMKLKNVGLFGGSGMKPGVVNKQDNPLVGSYGGKKQKEGFAKFFDM